MGKGKKNASASVSELKSAGPSTSARPAPTQPGPTKPKAAPAPTALPVQPISADKKRKKAQGDEIDAIFSHSKKKKASDTQEAAAAGGQPDQQPEAPVKGTEYARIEGSKDDIFGEDAGKKRKKTEEGWNIYTEDELGLGRKGGDTDLCPFDCDCCF